MKARAPRNNRLQGKRVLVTYGPTWVALDPMRVLSNRSTGALGKTLCRFLKQAGATVTALEGPVREPLKESGITIKSFTFFDEFKKLLTAELKKNYAVIIHAAAVSDFKPRKICRKKIPSTGAFKLDLLPAPKLIRRIKTLAPHSFLVGFKLESAGSLQGLQKAAMDSMRANRCDLVVANTLKDGYRGFIFDKNGVPVAKAATRTAMSRKLITQLKIS